MDPIGRVTTRLVAMEAPPVKRCANRACETPNLFGKFGTSEEDNGYDDTRKVLLAELLKNVDGDSLSVLQAFDKNIKKKVGAAKRAMLEEEEEADAERAASPPAPESAA